MGLHMSRNKDVEEFLKETHDEYKDVNDDELEDSVVVFEYIEKIMNSNNSFDIIDH